MNANANAAESPASVSSDLNPFVGRFRYRPANACSAATARSATCTASLSQTGLWYSTALRVAGRARSSTPG